MMALESSIVSPLFLYFFYSALIGKYLSRLRKLDHIIAPKEGFEAQL
jgi:hypothetical protein